MIPIEQFVLSVYEQGIKLWLDHGEIRYRAPRGVMTRGLRSELGRRKAELIIFLRQAETSSALPQVIPDLAQRHTPFPLTDIQEAYWTGRGGIFELSAPTHGYVEIECQGLDPDRLNRAWQKLIIRHEMLRTIILPTGEQQILAQTPPYVIDMVDLSASDVDTITSFLTTIRQAMFEKPLSVDRWPLFEIRFTLLPAQRLRIHFALDMLIADWGSYDILLREWAQLYDNNDINLPLLSLSFRDYVLAEKKISETELYRRSRDYWLERLESMAPAPELPLSVDPSSLESPRFIRYQHQLKPEQWSIIKARANKAGLTPNGILLAAFAEILNAWSKSSRFTINLTLFNRLPLDDQVNQVVGDFTSLTLLEVNNTNPDESITTRAKLLQARLWEDLDHRYYSGVQVLRKLTSRQTGTGRILMPVVFTSALGVSEKGTSWLGEEVYGLSQTPQVWLDSQAEDRAGTLLLTWDFIEELFPAGMIESMFEAYSSLLERLAVSEEIWDETFFNLLPETQLEQRKAVNATDSSVSNELLHTLFITQAQNHPDRVAVIASGRTLTYGELYEQAARIGHWLRQSGASPNTLVAVVMQKGWEQIAAVLGILMSGAAYLSVDQELPAERQHYLLTQGEVKFVLTQADLADRLTWPEGIQRLSVPAVGLDLSGELEPIQSPADIAYVIYTSGSTGMPKGVVIDHQGAVNTILDINSRFNVNAEDRVLALSSLSFDLSVYDIFGTLAAGGAIVVPDASGVKDPSHWADLITSHNITIWNSVPVLMELFADYAANRSEEITGSLRLALLSGDWLPVSLPDRIRILCKNKDLKMISMGGATEASIWSIIYPIGEVNPEWKSIPYGRAMVNQHFYVLNNAMQPCPVWVPGDLYIGGIGLAKGYWRDEKKTGASFITHPGTGERLYRTGDLGRFLPDGNIEFIGREDFQVKIQGYRVELGEIESALAQHPGVRSAAARAVGERAGDRFLAVYVVPAGNPAPAVDTLRDFLQDKLPTYMVPSSFIFLDNLPLSSNGKVDRGRLPEPDRTGRQLQTAPVKEGASELIEQIKGLVSGILKLDNIDPSANLLYLGATSVDMIRIANQLENTLGYRPKMDELYKNPSVCAMADSVLQISGTDRDSGEDYSSLMDPKMASIMDRFELLFDPDDREQFKSRQAGIRRDYKGSTTVQLNHAGKIDSPYNGYERRQSTRRFSSLPVSLNAFGDFLKCLSCKTVNGKPKYLYGSAGGLYPVQTYLIIKPERINDLEAGVYYYDPGKQGLVMIASGVELDRTVYDPLINRPIFDSAAFSIFFVAQMAAIVPLYGDRSMHYATIEAGLMSQLLETRASGYTIGLCQIGELEFDRIEHLFDLDENHIFVHSIIGGGIPGPEEVNSEGSRSESISPDTTELEEDEL